MHLKLSAKSLRKIIFVIFWAILIASFCFFAFLIILKANGYEINLKSRKIVETGMIVLDGEPKDAQIYLNGKILDVHLPARISNIAPGFYDIKIIKTEYHLWQKTFNVLPGKAKVESKIALFLTNPLEITEPLEIKQEDFLKEAKQNSQEIKILGSEIYYHDIFVTRFAQNIEAGYLYPDINHLVFQIGREIRIIDLDGSNNQLLFELETDKPAEIIFRDSGKIIYYLQGEKIIGKIIRK